jgi:hypothetical protein
MSRNTTTFFKLLILIAGVLIIIFGSLYLYFTFFYDQIVSVRNQISYIEIISDEYYVDNNLDQISQGIMTNIDLPTSEKNNQVDISSTINPKYPEKLEITKNTPDDLISNRGKFEDYSKVYSH